VPMQDLLSRGRWGPVAVAVAAVLAANLAVVALGLQGRGDAGPGPPGWLIGSVWVALFACMGGAYAALTRAPGATRRERAGLVALGLLCLAYPFYTGGFDSWTLSMAGTALTLVCATVLAVAAGRASAAAAALLVPLVLWLIFAAYLLL
jgi:translocator protein